MIEVIVGMGVAAMLITTIQMMMLQSQKISKATSFEIVAAMYAREGIEVAKDLEVTDWSAFYDTCSLGTSPDLHPEIVSDAWALASDGELLNGTYTRSIVIEPVFRDTSSFPNEIVATGGVCDDDTKRVVTTVTWNNGAQDRSIELETLVFNYPTS